MPNQKTILVAPLNWGLGHATRCIPIIKALQENGFTPLLASDGAALELLKKEFLDLEYIELPSYGISYSKKAKTFKWKLFQNSPALLRAIKKEKAMVDVLVQEGKIQGIISDNRLGIRHKKVPSAFITHQLNVLSGNTTILSTWLHNRYIKKFDSCWVPDIEGPENLSGILGHPERTSLNTIYLGFLSRLKKLELEENYDILVLLSGPEPQRTLLEEKLKKELKQVNKKILFVLGKVQEEQLCYTEGNYRIWNYMNSMALERAINESSLVICRSGYSTIMDLSVIEKKAFFIPTPGQFEQEYLAERLSELGIAPYCKQEDFKLEDLEAVRFFRGLKNVDENYDFSLAFGLFEGE